MDVFLYKLLECIKNRDYPRILSYFSRRLTLLGAAVRRWSRRRGKTVVISPLVNRQPLLSIFVLCDSTDTNLNITIKSLLRQTVKNFEVVLCSLPTQAPADFFTDASFQRADVIFRSEISKKLVLWNRMNARGKYVCCLHAGSLLSPTYLEKALFLLETYCYDIVLANSEEAVRERITLPHISSFFNIAAAYEKAVGKKEVWSSFFSAYKALIWGYLRRFVFFMHTDKIGGLLTEANQSYEQRDNNTCPTLLLCAGIITNGGGEKLTSSVARYLHQKGWRIIVIATHDNGACDSIPIQWFADSSDEIFLLHTFLNDFEERIDFIKYLLQSRRVNVLLQVGSTHVYDLMPQLYGLRLRLAVIDLLFNTSGHTESNQKYFRFIDNTIVENSEVKNYLLSKGREQDKITLISSGVSVPEVQCNEVVELRKKMQIEKDATIFGYAGRLSPEKNPQAFVELACRCSDMPSVHFVMTGAGPLEAEIKNILQQKNLKNFHYCGFVKDVFLYMTLFDMLIVPSVLDGRPLAIMEAMHCGTPCIASAIGGIPELIENGVTGVVVPTGNVAMFEEMIRYYASKPERINLLGKSAKEFAEQNLRMDSMLKKYESALTANFSKVYHN